MRRKPLCAKRKPTIAWRIALKYAEESNATDLHRTLTEELAGSLHNTEIGIRGDGVHWECFAKRGVRSCSIACFDT